MVCINLINFIYSNFNIYVIVIWSMMEGFNCSNMNFYWVVFLRDVIVDSSCGWVGVFRIV